MKKDTELFKEIDYIHYDIVDLVDSYKTNLYKICFKIYHQCVLSFYDNLQEKEEYEGYIDYTTHKSWDFYHFIYFIEPFKEFFLDLEYCPKKDRLLEDLYNLAEKQSHKYKEAEKDYFQELYPE